MYYAEDRTDTVATYTATDPENDTITWSLLGDDSGDFTISNTGELTFNTPPDRENPADKDIDNVYLVTVQASDGTNTVPLDVIGDGHRHELHRAVPKQPPAAATAAVATAATAAGAAAVAAAAAEVVVAAPHHQ